MTFNNFKQYQQYFKKRVEWERQEEIDRHWSEIKKLSPEKRQKLGRAILNIRSRNAGRGLGGTYLIKYVRHDGLPDTEISVGDLVIVSSGHPNGNEPQATVVEKTNFSLTIAFNDKPPRFVQKKPLRIDLFANDITFQRMFDAIDQVRSNKKVAHRLIKKRGPNWHEVEEPEFNNDTLNRTQRLAVRRSLEARNFYLIHGPPGTGKTTTLVESIIQHVAQGDNVLATADSNTAVDNLVDNLTSQGCDVVRVGNPVRVTQSLLEHTLDYKVQQTDKFKRSSSLWDQVDELKDEQKDHVLPSGKNRRGLGNKKIKRLAEGGKSARGLSPGKIKGMARWIEIQDEIDQIVEEAQHLEQQATREHLDNADVICTTNSTAGSEVMNEFFESQGQKVDVAFIDEATQSIEPSCLIPIAKAPKFVMAGDHRQLPPTVLHPKAEQDLQYTLFERLIDLYSDKVKMLLDTQYRMHEDIMAFPSTEFYDQQLHADDAVAGHTLDELLDTYPVVEGEHAALTEALNPQQPEVWVDTGRLHRAEETQRKGSTSYQNETEAAAVEVMVRSLLEAGLDAAKLGVISPYDDQVELLKQALGTIDDLEIKTVDGFQGREKETIIISFVRANREANIGFLNDLRRLNVSISRARRKLIMVGHAGTLRQHPTYRRLIDSTPHVAYVTAGKSVKSE